jgi:hypothetical protein
MLAARATAEIPAEPLPPTPVPIATPVPVATPPVATPPVATPPDGAPPLAPAVIAKPEPVSDEPSVRGGLAVRTDVPTFLGGVGFVEFPEARRLRLSAGIGLLPAPYAKAANGVLRSLGAYEEKVGDALATSLKSSLALRFLVSVKPATGYGFLLEGGYGLVQLSAQGDALREAEAQLAGVGLPPEIAGQADTSFRLKTTMHALVFGLGWEVDIEPGFLIGIHLNMMRVVASKTALAEEYRSKLTPEVEQAVSAKFGEFDASIRSNGWIPHVGVSAGYRF